MDGKNASGADGPMRAAQPRQRLTRAHYDTGSGSFATIALSTAVPEAIT